MTEIVPKLAVQAIPKRYFFKIELRKCLPFMIK